MKGSTKRENIARLPQDVVLWAGQMKVTEGTSFVKNTDLLQGRYEFKLADLLGVLGVNF